MQSRRASMTESLTNTAVGYLVSLASQLVIFPLVGIQVGLTTNLKVSAWFTAVSIVRGYALRRLFNRRAR